MKLALARQKIHILFNKFYKCHLKRVECVDRCNGNDSVKMSMMFQKKKKKWKSLEKMEVRVEFYEGQKMSNR